MLSCSLEDELYESQPVPGDLTIADARQVPDDPPPPAPTASTPTDQPQPLRLQLHLPPPPAQQNSTSTLMADTARSDGGDKDIGSYALQQNRSHNETPKQPYLTRDHQTELDTIQETIGSKQVSRSQLGFAPPWLLDESLKSEHDSNWKNAYVEVQDKTVPRDANVISSHVIYKVKTEEDGARRLKARIVPHGNHDSEKEEIRKDSSNAQLFVVRLLLSLVTFLDFRIATADITGAYLQSGPIKRDIYVRPPRDWGCDRSILWKLLKLPYGIVEAGRQWQTVVEEWMLNEAGLERVFGLSQLFTKRKKDGSICLIIAKVTDDFLIGGTIEEIHKFINALSKRFIVGKTVIDKKIFFDGCELEQLIDESIKMSMVRYLERLKPITISRTRKKERSDKAITSELKQYRSLACTLMYLGNGVLPQASYVTSLLQQLVARVTVEQLVLANDILSDLMKLKPWIIFKKPPMVSEINEILVSTFTDASFNKSAQSGYGQTGTITGLHIRLRNGLGIFHPVDWCSTKQRRVSYSPYGAEVLACADADDRGFYFKSGINSIFCEAKIRNELYTDSMCLYNTITTLHEGKDFRLRPTVQRIRNSFDSKELDFMRWIPGTINPADALTKRSPETRKLLNELLAGGTICMDLDSGYVHNSATWT